jgi:type II secretory pathway pseudopilin PulG
MGLEHYLFALFIAALVCIVALICKILFSNVKRQRKLLDERESQILQLYTSAETLMEEFNEQVKMTTNELKDLETRTNTQVLQVQKAQQQQEAQQALSAKQAQQQTAKTTAFDLPPELEKKEQLLDKLPRTLPLDANRIRVAGEVLERAERIIKSENIPSPPPQEKENTGAVFQKFFDDTAESTPIPPEVRATRAQTRTEAILELAAEGKTDVEIASKLGITRNEVVLVVGLKK